ncbi:MAG TPA: glycosyltransferase family 2 protein, partial [Gemmataceae bacterium]|nr:glycosyltransferase family 2 protein [Gemmataceae bacterium]
LLPRLNPLPTGEGLDGRTAPVDVSVCIVNWNCKEVLRGCLQSLRARTPDVRLEILVVDNASTDGAPAMVAEEFPEVVLLRNADNVGFARANNRAARLASGRYLFFLNNDTVVPASAIQRLVAFADAHPEVGMIGPRLRDGEGRLQASYRCRPSPGALLHRTSILRWTRLLRHAYRHYRRQRFDPEHVGRVELLIGAAVFVRRSVFMECGPWDEGYVFGGEDLDLSTNIGRKYDVVYLPSVEITHFGRVSTRQHVGFCFSHTLTGLARYLRRTGCSPSALLAYKLVVSLDAPVQFVGKAIQYAWRRLRGKERNAQQSLLAWRGFKHFLFHGLVSFWRA